MKSSMSPLNIDDNIFFGLKKRILGNNELYCNVLDKKEFRRLYHISFMGAIDYTIHTDGLLHEQRTRADHSIDVAILAYYVASKRGYNDDLKNHLFIAALLHDIGHLPLSHSLEHYFVDRFKYGHHEIGESIIKGDIGENNSLSAFIKDNFDTKFILSLLNKEASDEDGGDLFSSPINIDTIDGIYKSSRYLSKSFSFDRLELAKQVFLKRDNDLYLDKFWELKNYTYKNLINTSHGILSDRLGEINFGGYLDKELKESDFFKSEKNWHQIHKKLFKEFKLLKSNSLDRLPKSIEYTDRLYYIDYSCSNIYDKYKLKKRKEVLHNLDSSIKNFEPSTNLQLEFKYEWIPRLLEKQ